MEKVRRIYVEKKPGFDVEAQGLFRDLRDNLGISGLKDLRLINRYDMTAVSDEEYALARNIIFAEPPLDIIYDEQLEIPVGCRVFAMEYLPGQYDQRADSAAQCLQILTQKERPNVASAKLLVLSGNISDEDFSRIKNYCINPVESREASMGKPEDLKLVPEIPPGVEILTGFTAQSPAELEQFWQSAGLAMSCEDLAFCQTYFRDTEHRDPTITEIRVIDTYWSDHCRHTTFFTNIENVSIEKGQLTQPIATAFREYIQARNFVYGSQVDKKDICLMDIAIMGMKELKQRGLLTDLDESDEINACSIVVPAVIDGQSQEWLVMFKNETHNHPTEIEPFGGAATCLGGAIRDPLSGRTYVYQAMRVSGSGDPRVPVEQTLAGKLPQRKITTGAAAGYSSYGNQIGLATGQVAEVYDEGFVAKRMEIGAVVGAAPRTNVVRRKPVPGDLILLVGGQTGRDGCGGATGSSKEHTTESLLTCGAEVQKGNPPTERKIQRLFRHPAASTKIKKCNDFGAGGVSVAIGELADGLRINLDAVPKKYEGLDGTELAISESQERMAVVVAAEDAAEFCRLAAEENLEATVVAQVTGDARLIMSWRGQTIVNISREFLNTNGIKQLVSVEVKAPDTGNNYFRKIAVVDAVITGPAGDRLPEAWLANLRDLNVCSQKGLVERFDSTIGAATVIMPFGGRYQATPAEGMVAKLPVLKGETDTVTIMTYGYNPQLAKWSPFYGALFAVVEAVAKVVALGGDYQRVRLTLQEYFEKLGKDPERWGKPFSALLGAFYAQRRLGVPAIGGKDSMSGTFMDRHVPPTLVAFALATGNVRQIVSSEFKEVGSQVVMLSVERGEDEVPDFEILQQNFAKVHELVRQGYVLAAHSVSIGGLAAALSKMAFGNRIGFASAQQFTWQDLFGVKFGSLVLEIKAGAEMAGLFGDVAYRSLGITKTEPVIAINGSRIPLDEALAAWTEPLEKIFPTKTEKIVEPVSISFRQRNTAKPQSKFAKPRVFIPVFPGTNCEYDSIMAFTKAGGIANTFVIRNLTASDVEESIKTIVKHIQKSQIVMLPGGFSAGDEPDGSGKFIATMFRNPRIKAAVTELLQMRDGLMLGICNGFQALIKLGLVLYGEIGEQLEDSPTLTHNKIGRHVSCMAQTKVVSVLSPWFSRMEVGDIHTIALSHGEGRFVASPEVLQKLIARGQVTTQYVDLEGNPSNDVRYTPNGSFQAIEGITSPDGRVLGKMGHSERYRPGVAVNVPGNKYQPIFEGGINYFTS